MSAEALIDELARAEVAADACNQYAYDDAQNATRRENLRRYFAQMALLGPTTLLVGEAPGYLGCRRTGIPFSSERLLLEGIAHAGLLGVERGYARAWGDGPPRGEQTATIIWGELAALGAVALAWNAFPFHPHHLGLPASNRKPRAGEVRQGQPFLEAVLALFPLRRVVAVGNTAAEALGTLGVPHTRVRHPAQGGKHAFAAGLRELMRGV
jgi:uracil-DNA glycosylase